jgi:serine/threonine protein kinase
MTPELWERLKPLFHEALERDTNQRSAFIDEACGQDSELKSNLKMLLDSEAETTEVTPAFFVANGYSDGDNTRFQDGETVLGRFRVIRLIGRGGMGEVYEADDLQLGRVALKTIRGRFERSPDAFIRFRQEVLLARKITGPHICRIHEFFLIPATNGHRATAFLTMEYLDGITLANRLVQDRRLPWHEARQVALDLCEGLRTIHAEGIIHRDLKAGNIMLCNQGKSRRTVLMDFGLAMNAEVADRKTGGASSALEEGGIAGTPEYMAPEQFEGSPVTPATDIYALGVVLNEMVTGVRPYAAQTPIGAAIRRAHHPAFPSTMEVKVPPYLDRIIERCLEYEPSKRFQSADEVARELRAGSANIRYLHRDRPWVFRAACVLGLILAFWSGMHWWRARQYYRPSTEALHWYDSGLSALREGNYVKATRALEQATSKEPHFVMAHARLAEAWSELDFQGNSQRELLIAKPEAYRLPPLDRMYLDAIQATITHDYPRGVSLYRTILTRLPASIKADGYIDLGKAYERAGDPPHAIENYAAAARIDGNNPASFLHTAVLQSRLHHVSEAEKAFQRAESLFSAEMNQEGIAELDYARGYAANDGGKPKEALIILKRSFDEAGAIPSVQLQIRVLTQLSSAASRSDADQQAAEYANQAIRLARENQLDAWAANGLVRLATVQIHQRKFSEAEVSVREALALSRRTQQPRAEALANATLASLLSQKGLTDEVKPPALAAIDYYQKNGYFMPAATLSQLLIRAERDKGNYDEALTSANTFLDLATKSGNSELLWQAEYSIGNVYREMEDYPKALMYFEKAGPLSNSSTNQVYVAVGTAEVLWKLGRYSESDELLRITPSNEQLTIWIAKTRASSLLSRNKYADAISTSQKVLHGTLKLSPEDRNELNMDYLIASTHLGSKTRLQRAEASGGTSNKIDTPMVSAKKCMVSAELNLWNGKLEDAYVQATDAAAYYASKRQVDSELRSFALAAQSAKKLGRINEYKTYSDKVLDIENQIKQTWGAQAAEAYLSRPDIKLLLRQTSY